MSKWETAKSVGMALWKAGKYVGSAITGYEIGVTVAENHSGGQLVPAHHPLPVNQPKEDDHDIMIILLAMVVAMLFIIFVAIIGNKLCSSVITKAVAKYRRDIDA